MAVIGYGRFGRFHAEKVVRSEFAELVAVADIDPNAAALAEQRLGVRVTQDYRELLGEVDAVSVVVPPATHYEVSESFLKQGIDVLVEKPITDNLSSARRLVDLAGQNGCILQVGQLERFTRVAEILRGHLKRPLFIESTRIAPFEPRGTDVNVVLDLMIHDIDLVLTLVNSPIRSVKAAGIPVFSGHEDIANARIEFANGCIANITSSRVSLRTERRMRIFEPEQYTIADFLERKIHVITNPTGKPPNSLADVHAVETAIEEDDPLQKEIDAFALAAVQRTPPLVPGSEGLRALEVAIAVNECIEAHTAFVENGAGH